MTEDLVAALRDARRTLEEMSATSFDGPPAASLYLRAAAEIERLLEVVTIPLITPESSSSSALCIRVLTEHEKGQPVNAQDLINALMWRVKNQREQLARLNQRVSAMLAGGDCK